MSTANSEPPHLCPYLPNPEVPVTARDSRALGDDRGPAFYRLCLEYAQSKWREGFPAQALLQLNRAMSADLHGGEKCLVEFPIPYVSVAWMLAARPDRQGYYFGNPRRHWQHYATRMSGPRSEVRTWRAWACWALAVALLPEDEFPGDELQIAKERLTLPDAESIGRSLAHHGFLGECTVWKNALSAFDAGFARPVS